MALTLAGTGVVGGLSVPAPGLVLVDSVSFTAQSSVSVDGCFTSAYDNYRIVYAAAGSANALTRIRMRAAGVDDATANYANQVSNASSTTLAGARETAVTSMRVGSTDTTTSSINIDLIGPALPVATIGTSVAMSALTSPIVYTHGFGHNVATGFDGFSIIPASGTITGTVYVYGYNNVVGAADAYTNPPQSGLELVTTQSFSTASSVSVNNCFTSTYDNYRVVSELVGSAGAVQVNVRYRAASADAATANYNSVRTELNGGTSQDAIGATAAAVGVTASGGYMYGSFDIYSPVAARPTGLAGLSYRWDNSSAQVATAVFTLTSQFDGLTVYPDSGTITGSLSVYGYAKGA